MLRRALILVGALSIPGAVLACDGSTTASAASRNAVAAAGDKDPTACAKRADLVGANCSYATGMMAQRVMAEGSHYSYAGTMVNAENTLRSKVAAPFGIGPDGEVKVVANEVVDALTESDAHQGRVSLEGRLLEVDGITYFVLIDFRQLAKS